MDNEFGNRMPFSLEAEQSVLGSILIDPQCMDEIAGILKSDDFMIEQHKEIYSSMQQLFLTNKNIDPVILIEQLVKNGTYDDAGGKEYIKLLANTVPHSHNVLDYATIVRDKSSLRALIEASNEISDLAYAEENDVPQIIEMAEQKIYSIAEGHENKNFITIKDAILSVYDRLHELETNRDEALGVPTGFSDIDKVLVGLGKTDLVLVGARPGMGKTAFTMNIATNVAKKTSKKVCVFSLEMSAEQLVTRMISSEALIESIKLRSGKLNDDDYDKLAYAASELSKTNILIDDTAGITVSGMKAKLRRVKDLGLVVIDYLQLMQSDRRVDNRVNEVAEISRSLKLLAKEFKVPVITCAQLSRGPESRNDKRPMLSDLRDSGAIEQDADVVLFLYRDEYYKNQNDTNNIAEVIIAKNRHGSLENIKMGFLGQYTKFSTLAEEQQ